MERFKRAGLFGGLLAVLTLSGVGSACPPFASPGSQRDPGLFFEENAEALSLDGETLRSIRSIVEKTKASGDSLHARLRELQEGMRALLDQSAPDESAVMKQADAIGAAEAEIHKQRLGTLLEIRALLTPEQREKLSAMHGVHAGCPMQQGADCPMHQKAGCPMHQGAGCPMQQGGDCPMHQGAGCPMQQGGDCPMHRGAGRSAKPEASGAY